MPVPDIFAHLSLVSAAAHPELVATPVAAALIYTPSAEVFTIDPEHADTAELCAAYNLPAATMANCVVVNGRRGDVEKTVACLALASTRVDVNNLVRKKLDVRKASFAPMDFAVGHSAMEYGGITPIGLPADWPIWIDAVVIDAGWVCIGSGLRTSKLLVPASELAQLPGAEVIENLARPVG